MRAAGGGRGFAARAAVAVVRSPRRSIVTDSQYPGTMNVEVPIVIGKKGTTVILRSAFSLIFSQKAYPCHVPCPGYVGPARRRCDAAAWCREDAAIRAATITATGGSSVAHKVGTKEQEARGTENPQARPSHARPAAAAWLSNGNFPIACREVNGLRRFLKFLNVRK